MPCCKRVLRLLKYREPTILKNRKIGFIEAVHENLWEVKQFSRPKAPALAVFIRTQYS